MGKPDIEDVFEPNTKNQYFAAVVVNMLTIAYGISSGWASPSIALLTSDASPLLSGQISMDEASWIASLLCIGGLIGNILFGWITSKWGRKLPMLLLIFPTFVGWALIWFAQNAIYLYAGRVLQGIVGGAIFAIFPLYLSEIAVDSVRGILGSTIVMSNNIGILLAYIFGNYFDFYMMPKFVIVLTALFGILFFFFPETPAVLIKQQKISSAESSLRFYQNLKEDVDCEVIKSEMNKLQTTTQGSSTKETESIKWSDVVTGVGKKAMLIGIVLSLLNQLCGCFAMMQYTANIFKAAGSNMAPNMCAIVVGIIQLLGSNWATGLVDKAGRKYLFLVSSVGIALGEITLGVYMLFYEMKFNVEVVSWIPITSFSFVIFIASWAVLTLPFLVISEVMPEKLKDFGLSFCVLMLWLASFIVTKCFPILMDLLHFSGTIFLFAGCCLSSALFIFIYLPETKGKSYDEIMYALSK